MSANTNLGNTPVNQGYVQLFHTGETGGVDTTLRQMFDGDGTASDLYIASNAVKIGTTLYIGSDTLAEYIQDTVGAMFSGNTETNITVTYQDSDGTIDLVSSGEVTLTGSETLSNKTLAAPTLTGTTQGASITLSGDLTVNGTTTTVNQTNLDVSDNIIGLNRGSGSNANDSGLIIERGSTGDNAAIIWDESADKFTLGTTTSTPSATGDLTISTGTLVATIEGNVTGNVTGSASLNLLTSNNLSDLASASTARSNLGLGALAVLGTVNASTITDNSVGADELNVSGDGSSSQFLRSDGDGTFTWATPTDTNTTYTGGTNLTLDGTEFNVDDAFLINSGNDTTSGTITAGGFTTTGNLSLAGHAVNDIDIGSEFVDADDHLMSAGAIKEKIESYGYTTTGAITALNNATANELVTVGSTTTELDAESGLTYDGDMLTVSGSGGSDGAAGSPTLRINNTVASSDWDTGDVVGALEFYSADTSGNAPYVTSYIKSVNETGNGTLPGGALTFGVADYNASGGAAEAMRITEDSDIYMLATKKLYLDGGSHTWISEVSDDLLEIHVGNTRMLKIEEGGTDYVYTPDNIRLAVGDSTDLEIYHDNTNSYIVNGTGDLVIRNNDDDKDILFQTDNNYGDTTNYIALDGSAKVTHLYTDTALAATKKLYLDGGSDTYIYEAGADNVGVYVGGSHSLTFLESGGTNYTYVPDNAYLGAGSGIDFTIRHDTSHTYIVNSTGDMIFRERDAGNINFTNVSGTSHLYIKTGGNVGIGTTSPEGKVHIYNGDASVAPDGDADELVVENSGDSGISILSGESDGNTGSLIFGSQNDGNGAGVVWEYYSKTLSVKTQNSDGILRFASANNSEAARFDTSGRLVVGHTAAIANVAGTGHCQVLGTGGGDSTLTIGRFSNNSSPPTLAFSKSRNGTIGSNTIVQDGDNLGQIVFSASDGSDMICNAAKIEAEVDGTPGSNDMPGRLGFYTAADGATGATERMRIDSAGLVGIGTSSPGAKLDIENTTAPTLDNDTHAGEAIFIRSGGSGGDGNVQAVLAFGKADSSSRRSGSAIASVQTDSDADKVGIGFYTSDSSSSSQTMDLRMLVNHTGNLHVDADVVAYSTSVSDERLKDNVKTIDNALDKVMQLRGVEFDWNKGNRKGQKDLGLIAQEVEKVLPEIVREKKMAFIDNETYKTIDYDKVVGVLIEAIKEQQEEIELLKANYDQLKYNRR